ncbi:aldehyde dehydrogenase [Lepidopterella palustris CBS 459.81]|uniref:aldehyde dehydrogenase (NAD(+)) n=1 Tax=Lepidopterella palustris CBS 459.81 TaxID=1314670 RepID=A0A8E2EEL4_9PEZI|nr:aldehyde dehydrogenase [Lepidopterella palustris CBS 459.81]
MASTLSFTTFYNIIDGKPRSSKVLSHGYNPATRERLWDVPVATSQDIEDTVKAAKRAFKTWSKVPLSERAALLKKYQDALEPLLGELGELVLKEIGKPRQFAHHEACLKLEDKLVQGEDREYRLRYMPLGVVAAISPWNYPLGQAAMKFLPGLMAGNTVIVKPSPFAPYATLKLVEIGQQFLPPGVLQVLNGDDALGPALVNHPDIAKITFAGSCATGKKIAEAAARTMKRVTLELGGNDAAIVCPDVDVKAVAPQVVMGAFFNTGQVCTGTKRIYIHKDIYASMLSEMGKAAQQLKVGDGSENGTIIGPVQNEMQYGKVKDLFEDTKKNGYKTVNGGIGAPTNGFYFEPTIVDSPPENARVVIEEQFGPIVPSMPWTDEAELIERVNDSNMGLGASIWSNDVDRATRIAEQLDVGSVHINSFEKVSIKIPFGGHKESGIGVECGPNALESFCNLQVLHYYGDKPAEVH